AARAGAQAAVEVDADELNAGGRRERHTGLVGERGLEEVTDHRRRGMAAGRVAPERARLVVAEIDADREVGCEADEPSVLGLVGGAGLAGDRLADLAQNRRGAAYHDTLHDRDHLVGGHRVEYLLAPVDHRRFGLIIPFLGVAAAALARVVAV